MRYRVLKFCDKLDKNCRVFLTGGMEESIHPLAKKWLIRLLTKKDFAASRLSPPPSPRKNCCPPAR